MTSRTDPLYEVSHAVARMKAGVLAIIFAVICGGGLFLATVWLLIKGGPRVGEHLNLLSHFFIGYSVSWGGSVVGLFWGALAGAVIGWTLGLIYNSVVGLRTR